MVKQGDVIAMYDPSTATLSSPVLILTTAKWAALAWPLVSEPATGVYHLDDSQGCAWVFIYDSTKWVALSAAESCSEDGFVGFTVDEEKPVPLIQHCLEAHVNQLTFHDLLTLLDHFGLSSANSGRMSRLEALKLICGMCGDCEFLEKVLSLDNVVSRSKKGAKDGDEVQDAMTLLLMEHFDQDELGDLKTEKADAKRRVNAAKQGKWRSLLNEKLKGDQESCK